MDAQAGAPPDDFTAVGPELGISYLQLETDAGRWLWAGEAAVEQMSYYFDAFRIDHILGFFRIWSVPAHAVQGIMGRFVPCLPVHFVEFGENGIWFDDQRFCKPFINDPVLHEIFGLIQNM